MVKVVWVDYRDKSNGILTLYLSDGRKVRIRVETRQSRAHPQDEVDAVDAVNGQLKKQGSNEQLYQIMRGNSDPSGPDTVRLLTNGDYAKLEGASLVGADEVYAPTTGSIGTVEDTLRSKVSGQSPNVVLDLSGSNLSDGDVTAISERLSGDGLDHSITVVRNGQVVKTIGAYRMDYETGYRRFAGDDK
jgi:hypothetical protein